MKHRHFAGGEGYDDGCTAGELNLLALEKLSDYLDEQISDYLVKINQNSLPIEDAKMIAAYFHVNLPPWGRWMPAGQTDEVPPAGVIVFLR